MANGLSEHPPEPPTLEQRGKVILGTTLFLLHLPLLIFEIWGREWHDMAVSGTFLILLFSCAARSSGLSLLIVRALLLMPAIALGTIICFGFSSQPLGGWKPTVSDLFGLGGLALFAYGALIWVFFFSPPVRAYLRLMNDDDVRQIFIRAKQRREARARAGEN
jgi:hypothetical protein